MQSQNKIRATLNLEIHAGKPGTEPGAQVPPTEFRIFPFGVIDTVKGKFIFDMEAGERLIAAWKDYGNRLPIDYEHQALEPVSNGPVPAAGWFDLELREDGLWAVNVEWTPRAVELISKKEYRYISPAFYTDEKGRIIELINVALTNIPATKRLQPLVASRSGEIPEKKEVEMEKESAFLARLSALTGREQPEQIEAVILAWREAHKQVEALTKELEAIKAERQRERLERLIEKGQAEGKLTPAMLSWARSLTPEALEAFLEVAPRVLNTQPVVEPQKVSKTWHQLTGQERVQLFQENPEEYRRLRKEALGY